HYASDVTALRRAWQQPRVTFETAQVPPPAELGIPPGRMVHPDDPSSYVTASKRSRTGSANLAAHSKRAMSARSIVLRDPAIERRAIDFYTFFSQQAAATINALCSVLKRACKRRKLVGAFYGYMWPHWNNLSPARQGHAALSTVLKSRNIDFIIAPYH